MKSAAARALSLSTLVRSRALEHGARLAVADGAMRVTYAELDARTDRLAGALAARGLGAGDRVAILLLDGLPAIELLIACGKLGAIAVPLNWRLSAQEIAFIVEAAAPKLFFHSGCFAQLVPPAAAPTAFAVRDRVAPGDVYERLVEESVPVPAPAIAADVALFMLYTSGTTGRPKGCLQSHQGVVALACAFALRLGLAPSDRLIATSPFFHVGGLGHVFAAFAAGAGIVVAPRGASSEEVLRLISSEGCTFGSCNDALIAGLVEAQHRLKLPLALRSITRGSSMTPAAQIEQIGTVLGAEVVGGYGQTESLGFVLTLSGREMIDAPTALGWPLAHVEAAVLDPAGEPVAGAATGELGLRGPAVMLGYWQDEAASAEATGTGWLRTGDIVRRDEAGLFHFEGRSKELVKTGGENVYPREVEQVLLSHPAIADAAIVGVPDARWGEAVKACIVLRPGATLEAREAVAWCRAGIAGYKRPRYVEFIDRIPRDHLGKIQRAELRRREVTPAQAVD